MPFSRSRLHDISTAKQASLLVSLGLADSGHDMPPVWLVNAIRSLSTLWPLIIIAKLCSIVVMFEFGEAFNNLDLMPMATVALLSLLVDIIIWLAPRLNIVRSKPPYIQHWILLPLAMASAVSFGLWLLVVPESALTGMYAPAIVAQVGTALVALSIFGNQRLLGLAYCIGAVTVVAMVMAVPEIFAIVGLYLIGVALATFRQARTDQKGLWEKRVAELRGERAERLLSEYEDAGRGWFWETDRTGRLTYISETLARTIGSSAEALIGTPMTNLIQPQDFGPHQDGGRTLGFHLSARSPFADIAVRAVTEAERWWAISGHPIMGEFGQFQGFRGSGIDLTKERQSQDEAKRLAQYDSLTGLSNRVQMMQTLEQAIIGPKGQPGHCALFLLDLDRFKSVNDTLGHPAGDALLRQVSQRLLRIVGDKGRVGRLGGDEFKVVMPGLTDRAALSALAMAIIDALAQPYSVDGSKVLIGASIGVAIAPDDGVTTEALIRNADLALYAAKGDGRGVHRFYAAAMHADAEDRRQLESDLRQALVNDGLHLAYQPVVSATTERITGFEALLRWNHPVRGPISPALFIPIAEDAGLIAQIGEWVLRTACKDAVGWPGKIQVAVNVSPIQFANPSLPSIVMSALANAQLDASRLELEITEGVFLNDSAGTDAMFKSLKGLGVRLALDDFGTGYSSLGYLKKAPFDKIKIDQSFVRGAAIKGNRNSAIIKSIVSLAEALGMDTTAEGAETHDELELIRSLGCSHIQGYIYGRPMSLEQAIEKLSTGDGHALAQGFKASRETRKTMLRSVTLQHEGYRYTGRIRNISNTGAMIEGLVDVPSNTRFLIELAEGYSVEAESRWCSDDRIGVEFLTRIDLSRLNATSVTQPQRRALTG